MLLITQRDKLQAVLGEAKATNDDDWTVWWLEAQTTPTANRKLTKSNGVTPVDILAANALDEIRQVTGIIYKNRDTIPHTVVVTFNDGVSAFAISSTFSVPIAGSLVWTNAVGWQVYGSGGALSGLAQAGQLIGTQTNDNAPAGFVGEYLESDLAAVVPLVTGTPANACSLALTAGDWNCSGTCVFSPDPTTTASQCVAALSLVSATLPSPGFTGKGAENILGVNIVPGAIQALPTGARRVSLAAPATLFLVAQCTFAVAAQRVVGFIAARRAR